MSTINLIHASCADQTADAVVNAANRYLLAGGGICGVIFRKAGMRELTEACEEHETPLQDGEAVITPSFQMTNAKVIIHAVDRILVPLRMRSTRYLTPITIRLRY